ncbi:recombinase family protein [Mucilaginibacter sabulilitoris]|uniref:Recombinase family protein n=1 Tax=Mucilaginibacter sabulilitoris TaxID=1173583 RepID=A0ABZ0TYM5_9SPHI|nr:recombinase family protein [Mucilaginibacter sabulilitoris]WPU96220.1 recombinase family protein [Mucilaginibacter sabulilitoris]
MKSAYIYVRVSTDEQRRRGYSLIEQEERLLEYCATNNIQVSGVFREDHSAKDFNRPEWKKLIKTIKKNKNSPPGNVLFLKWDRFSRNIQYAYQMIEILKDLNIQAMAIDQPIDFEVPEAIVILAIYLSIPQAENSRRGKNTSDGLRRAKKMGRYAGKAPIGYQNVATPDGMKFILPKQPEADHVKWSFEQFATGNYTINQVAKMASLNGLRYKENVRRLLRNPIYCGFITIAASKSEDMQLIKGIHEPLISEELFETVQALLISRRRQRGIKQSMKPLFPLRGFLTCPNCARRLTGSISTGRNAKYRYYHCYSPKCKVRFKADELEKDYEMHLKNIQVAPGVLELFKLILEDENIFTARKKLLKEREALFNEFSKQEAFMLRVRKLLVEDKIDYEDFHSLKREQKEKSYFLNERLIELNQKISKNEIDSEKEWLCFNPDILFSYKNQDIVSQRQIISQLQPTSINPLTGNLNFLQIDPGLSKIIIYNPNSAR